MEEATFWGKNDVVEEATLVDEVVTFSSEETETEPGTTSLMENAEGTFSLLETCSQGEAFSCGEID